MGSAKYQRDGDPKTSGPGFGVMLHPRELDAPLRWRKPRLVFVNSMSDLFHEEIPVAFIRRVFDVMVEARQHTFQVLTKRHERLAELAPSLPWPENVWMGVSIENRRFVHRADYLRETPAAVRFISAEPLLGPLLVPGRPEDYSSWPDHFLGPELHLREIDWVIVGGESGPGHRPMKRGWVRDLRNACVENGIAFFLKQLGGHPDKRSGRKAVVDGRTWIEMPSRARVPA